MVASRENTGATWLESLAQRLSPRLRVIHRCSLVASIVLATVTVLSLQNVVQTQARIDAAGDAYEDCQNAANELAIASAYLTKEAQDFVLTGDPTHLDNYMGEIQVANRRGKALDILRAHAEDKEAVKALEDARKASDQLSETELYAMRLASEARGMSMPPGALADVELDDADANLSPDQMRERVHELVLSSDYDEATLGIRTLVGTCSDLLQKSLRNDLEQSSSQLSRLLGTVFACVALMLAIVLFVVGSTSLLLLMPMSAYEDSIQREEPLVPSGALELRHLSQAYNDMHARVHDRIGTLSFQARNDALTGVYNRGAFEGLLTQHRVGSALLLIDIDLFKHFNDEHGHEMGDAILVEVAATLKSSFRSTDYVCRIGGDEFAVILTNIDASLRHVIAGKLEKVAGFLRDTANGLPPATLSIGIAFGTDEHTDETLFHEADAALYAAKGRGRDGYVFYDDIREDA